MTNKENLKLIESQTTNWNNVSDELKDKFFTNKPIQEDTITKLSRLKIKLKNLLDIKENIRNNQKAKFLKEIKELKEEIKILSSEEGINE